MTQQEQAKQIHYPLCFILTIATALLYIALRFGYKTRTTGIARFCLPLIGNSVLSGFPFLCEQFSPMV